MTETVRKENEILENQAAEKAPNPVYKALCRFASWFGFGSKLYGSNKHRKKIFFDVITYIILIGGSLTMLYPFWWMLVASLNNNTTDTLQTVFWPNSIAEDGFFYNYSRVIQKFSTAFVGANYWRIVANTILYSVVPVVVGVVMSAAAAFSFAKIEWVGRNAVFMFLLAAIMVPGPSIMTTQYVMYVSFGWLSGQGYPNAWMTLTIPGMFGAIMTAFFIRQFLFGLPTSIVEAAKIDGAGYFRIFCSFIMPLAMPAIVAQGLLSFMGCWNNYMGSLIFIPQSSLWVNLPHAMTIMNNNYTSDVGPVMAAAVMCVLPVIILFAIFQKMIIGSLMLTGSKE